MESSNITTSHYITAFRSQLGMVLCMYIYRICFYTLISTNENVLSIITKQNEFCKKCRMGQLMTKLHII